MIHSRTGSLRDITKRMIDVIRERKYHVIDVTVIADTLRINKRRVYDIINVWESTGLLQRIGKNRMYIRPKLYDMIVGDDQGDDQGDQEDQDDVATEQDMLAEIMSWDLSGKKSVTEEDHHQAATSSSEECVSVSVSNNKSVIEENNRHRHHHVKESDLWEYILS